MTYFTSVLDWRTRQSGEWILFAMCSNDFGSSSNVIFQPHRSQRSRQEESSQSSNFAQLEYSCICRTNGRTDWTRRRHW